MANARFVPFDDFDRPVDPADCYFYHTIDLPGLGLRRGHWDIRGHEDDYLGRYDFAGKTVLDVGVASGFLAFAMEARGAAVVGLDLAEDRDEALGIIPWADFQERFGISLQEARDQRRRSQAQLRNSFIASRRALGSNVRLLLGNVMTDEIPVEPADAALFGSILLHLRDPIAALYNVARHVREAVIVAEPLEIPSLDLEGPPALLFRPSVRSGGNVGTWHYASPAWLRTVLEVVGFRRFDVRQGIVRDDLAGTNVPVFNLTAYRT